MIRLLLLFVVLMVLIYVRNVPYDGNVFVHGNYSVHVSHEHESTSVVKVLRDLRHRANRLVSVVCTEHPDDPRVIRLKARWNGVIHEIEHEHMKKGVFGYNVNKGRGIAVCVHDSRGTPNRFNDMFFVVMHEMSHAMTDTYDHDKSFWDAFEWLVSIATKHKLFVNTDYGKHPSAFCDGFIDENPTFSSKKK